MTYINRQLLKECRRGHVARIERLVADGADVNHRGKDGHSPLIEAASQGHTDAVCFLLGAGADASLLTSDNAPTLFYACVQGHVEVVELLLDAGASPNANRDSSCTHPKGDTPGVSMLHIAITHRYPGVVEALLGAGAYTDFIVSGKDALAAAIETGENTIIELVKRGVVRRWWPSNKAMQADAASRRR